MTNSIISNWISTLSFKQQAYLLMLIRNCDIVDYDDPSRVLVNEYRKVIFKSIVPVNDIDELSTENEDRDFRKLISKICMNCNKYPLNFYKSLLTCSQIIGHKHPDFKTKKRWFDVYVRLCQRINLHIETEEDLDIRLGD